MNTKRHTETKYLNDENKHKAINWKMFKVFEQYVGNHLRS